MNIKNTKGYFSPINVIDVFFLLKVTLKDYQILYVLVSQLFTIVISPNLFPKSERFLLSKSGKIRVSSVDLTAPIFLFLFEACSGKLSVFLISIL